MGRRYIAGYPRTRREEAQLTDEVSEMKKLEDYPLTLKEAAHRLGSTCNAIRRFVAAGKLNAAQFGPLRELRFKDEDLEEFLAVIDPARLDRQLVQRIKATEPHYQGMLNLSSR